MGFGYAGLSSAYYRKKDFDLTLEMRQKSIEVWKTINYRSGICNGLHEMGKLYSEQGREIKALEVLNESLELMKKIKHLDQSEVEKLIAELKEQSSKE
ncbi:tetratricopeptide repeat protein [Planctomycetota bacterium]